LEKVGDELPEKIARMREKKMDSPMDLTDASAILTTVHQAKGIEYDNVKLLDDFVDLRVLATSCNPLKAYFKLPAMEMI
jgi:superfamily I DNA/RNA helicase